MSRVAKRTKIVIKSTATVMGLAFGWLQLGNEDVGRALSGSSPELLLRVALALYYTAWVAGTIHDTSEQEYAYAVGPSDRSSAAKAIGAAVTISAVFAGLCLVNSARVFALVLAAFLALNYTWWHVLTARTIRGPIAATRRRYDAEENYIGLLVLENMENYIGGEWQKWRFGLGGVMIAAIAYVAFIGVPVQMNEHRIFSDRDRALGVMILAYVCGIESWIWVERLKLSLARKALLALRDQYRLVKHSN